MLNDLSSPLSLLETRRSSRPRDLVAPGPSPTELERILTIAARTPDHGKLAPWRFVEVTDRAAFAALLERAYRAANPDAGRLEIEAAHTFAHQAPTLIVVLSAPVVPHKIPVWEQELSCGAAAMNLLLAAHALGYAGGWVTGWAAFSDIVRDAFGSANDRIAGFFFLGTRSVEPEERLRPALGDILSRWPGT
ncbi:nitroreductase family protein [Allosphingosinicella indica]|uniref:Putative NAD(P)H nitroreductase n=1 Tax=Allosphingosinicella indica TaxID=941907 RepID=A0A1X7GIW2_9SPHN|nr:nitroreductase family protein [Allosphingosinicella indica]SMF70385.1 Nitroreductase [Allosphingosinicella indica]